LPKAAKKPCNVALFLLIHILLHSVII